MERLQTGQDRSSTSKVIRLNTVPAGQRYAMVMPSYFSRLSMLNAKKPSPHHHDMQGKTILAFRRIVHFNNMLAAILGYTELVMDDVPRESLAWHRLQRVLTAGERAKDLVRQILTVSRQQEQERRPVQLRLLTEEVLKLLRASLPVTIAIHQHLDPQVGTVLADPTQIYQVLMNLCINAEHAMRLSGG